MNNLDRFFVESESAAQYARRYVEHLGQLLTRLDFSAVEKFTDLLDNTRRKGQTVFFVGNGGSAATASHWVNDLSIGTQIKGAPYFRALSLTDNVSLLTALGNDRSYQDLFVGQLEVLFRQGDVLVGISASGNSPNVLRAIEYANDHGGTTVGLTGFDGGQMRGLCHLCINVETAKGEYGPVEDVHLVLDHLVTSYLKARDRASAAGNS